MRADIIKGSIVSIHECDDGSILVEVIHPNNLFRFGVSFEKDEKESSWYFVSKPECKMSDLMLGETLLPQSKEQEKKQ